MIFAHVLGMLVMSIAGALFSNDPSLDDMFSIFLVGMLASSVVFVPVLLFSIVAAKRIFRNVAAFAIGGPVVISLFAALFGGVEAMMLVGLTAATASLFFYVSVKLDNPVDWYPSD